MTPAFAASCAALALIGVGAVDYKISTHIEERAFTVTGKERLSKVSGADGNTSTNIVNYVYSEDQAYTVKDSLWLGHFTSSTVYAKIQVGETCVATLSGYRVGLLSMFQNIVKWEC